MTSENLEVSAVIILRHLRISKKRQHGATLSKRQASRGSSPWMTHPNLKPEVILVQHCTFWKAIQSSYTCTVQSFYKISPVLETMTTIGGITI